jgi:D-alanine-D-alanine ligase
MTENELSGRETNDGRHTDGEKGRNATGRLRVVVLFGGRSAEHDVSCASAARTVSALDRTRYQVQPVRISTAGEWAAGPGDLTAQTVTVAELERLTPMTGTGMAASLARILPVLDAADVVIPVLHGPYGEDGTVQGMLELLDVPYVGNGVMASAAGMDKEMTKKLLAARGIPLVPGVVLGAGEKMAQADREALGLPLFVKPARGGSSIGAGPVREWEELDAVLAVAREVDDKVLVERSVTAREVEVGVLQLPDGQVRTGPPLEIRFNAGHGFFGYDAKYRDQATVLECPANLPPEVADKMRDIAVDVFQTLGCSGLLRVDFFLCEGDELFVNEVNTFPGITPASQYPAIWEAAGMSVGDLMDRLIQTTLVTRPRKRDGEGEQSR